jgi:hypothetical protein
MPFVSKQQQKWGHSPAGEKALGGPQAVAEWDQATAGKKLPIRVGKHIENAMRRGTISEHAVRRRAKKRGVTRKSPPDDWSPKASSI